MCLALEIQLQARNKCHVYLSLQFRKIDRGDIGRPLFSPATVFTSGEGTADLLLKMWSTDKQHQHNMGTS